MEREINIAKVNGRITMYSMKRALAQLSETLIECAAILEEFASQIDVEEEIAAERATVGVVPETEPLTTVPLPESPALRGTVRDQSDAERTGEQPADAERADREWGSCPKREDRPHLFEPMRERDGIYIEKCVSCSTPRWCPVDSPFPREFTYGPPPAPARVRIMGPDEELAPGETFERGDTDVPRVISTPQREGRRLVNGRVLEYEEQ